MPTPRPTASAVQPGDDQCWNRIGVRGDRSCPRLADLVHCRNCDVYAAAAARLLERPQSEAARAAATAHFAQPKPGDARLTGSVVVFRTGAEWVALLTSMVVEVAPTRPIHSLPHRRGGPLLGLTNVRGELLVCLDLARLLEAHAPAADAPVAATARLLVVQRGGERVVFPVDEVHGVRRLAESELKTPPAAPARQHAGYTRSLLTWGERAIGCLDEARLWRAVEESLG